MGITANGAQVHRGNCTLSNRTTGIASQNGVQLDCEIAEEDFMVLGDPTQLTRALQNVNVNAIQAATEKRGKVVVNCQEKDLYADIQVRDSGYGIAEEEIG